MVSALVQCRECRNFDAPASILNRHGFGLCRIDGVTWRHKSSTYPRECKDFKLAESSEPQECLQNAPESLRIDDRRENVSLPQRR